MNILFIKCRCAVASALLSACILLPCSIIAVSFAGQDRPSQGSASDVTNVTVEFSDLDRATIYTASSGDCSITWIAHTGGPNQGVIKHSPRCDAPMTLQISLLTKICTALFSHDKDAGAFRTLFWGGLEAEGKPAAQELQFRLALAAYRSPGWDVRKGRPKSGDTNGFVKSLANGEPIYPELQELFNHFDRHITLAVVEKVRVLEAGKLPFYSKLKQHGVKATDMLPFDCMAWFSLSAHSQ